MNPDNRRTEMRLTSPLAIFVEIRAADPAELTGAEIVACQVVDISANGIQVEMDQPPAIGSILRLGADPGQGGQVMYVVGEVRWVRPAPVGGYGVGFAFFDSDGTDIIEWKHFIAARLRD